MRVQKRSFRFRAVSSTVASTANDIDSKFGYRLRAQLYRQAFYVLDENLSTGLEVSEVSNFGRFMFGDDWNEQALEEFMAEADTDKQGVTLMEGGKVTPC